MVKSKIFSHLKKRAHRECISAASFESPRGESRLRESFPNKLVVTQDGCMYVLCCSPPRRGSQVQCLSFGKISQGEALEALNAEEQHPQE